MSVSGKQSRQSNGSQKSQSNGVDTISGAVDGSLLPQSPLNTQATTSQRQQSSGSQRQPSVASQRQQSSGSQRQKTPLNQIQQSNDDDDDDDNEQFTPNHDEQAIIKDSPVPEGNHLLNGRESHASNRELVNRTRNGYYNTKYFTDVKEYFSEKNFDDDNVKRNKKYLQDLLHDFRKLLENSLQRPDNKLHDVIFIDKESDEDEGLPAHKQLLIARSATFEAVFNSKSENFLGFVVKQNADGITEIELPSDPKISRDQMEIVLHYMYWGHLDEQKLKREDELKKLFKIASFLDLKELRRRLADRLYDQLSKKSDDQKASAIEYLRLAVKCGCKYLKGKSIDYIVDNKSAIFKTDEWAKFIGETDGKVLVKEIYQRNVEKSTPK